jgi:hypothetical protein
MRRASSRTRLAQRLTLRRVGSAPSKGARTPRLEDVLAYRNPEVVARFLEQYPIDRADAEDIFTEMKRWLWLMMRDREGGRWLSVTHSMFAIDEMWHAFLMYTADYTAFSFDFFGEYVHHFPSTTRDKERASRRAQKDPDAFARAEARRMERQYRYVARHLGEDTLRKWYVELADKYPAETLRRLSAQATLKASPSIEKP